MEQRVETPARPTGQVTVLAGPGREWSLLDCAQKIMNNAGLYSLSQTNNAVKADKGVEIAVSFNRDSNEISIENLSTGTTGWVVVQQFASEPSVRASFHTTAAGAAALLGQKLALQEGGAVTVSSCPNAGLQAVHYVGAGNSRITSLTMLPVNNDKRG